LPGVASYFAGDVVWEALDMLPTGGVIHGRDRSSSSRVERWEGRQASCFTCSRW
jgi:hypothetical protein